MAASACNTTTNAGDNTANQKPIDQQISEAVILSSKGRKHTPSTVYRVKIQAANFNIQRNIRQPIRSAECKLNHDLFTATVASTTVVTLPSFGPNAGTLEVTCSDGDRTATKSFPLSNLTKIEAEAQAMGHMLFGFGLVGVAVTAARSAERDKSEDVWGYANVNVDF